MKLKGIFAPLVLAIGLHTPAIAEDRVSFTLLPTSRETQQLEYVRKHVFFVLDYSASMEDDEKKLLHDGIQASFANENILAGFESGNSYALTFVLFGERAVTTNTYIVNNPFDAQASVNQALFSEDRPKIFSVGSSRTFVAKALEEVYNMITTGENERGFHSEEQSIVIIGDDAPSDGIRARKQAATLIDDYKTPISCIALDTTIHGTTAYDYYNDYIITHEEQHPYTTEWGYETYVPAGQCERANLPKHMISTVAKAMAFTQG